MELRDYFNAIRRRWVLAAVIFVVTILAAAASALLVTPQYTSTTRLFFAVQGTGSATDLAQGSNFAERQMTSYVEVASSPLVLDPVISQLRLGLTADQLTKMISVDVPNETVILDLSVSSTDPAQATLIANAVGAQLAAVAATLSPDANGSDAVKATTLAPAAMPISPSSPLILENLAVGLVIGLVLGIGAALLRQSLDTKVHSELDLRGVTSKPVLGSVAFDEHLPERPVIIADEPHSNAAEAIRRLRTNFQFIGSDTQCKSVVVTSSIPGEGKSTTSINLAASLADAGSRVILVDADLRRPSVAKYSGLEGRAGLTNVLIGRAELGDVIQSWRDTSLAILPAGPVPPNPSELLGSAAMTEVIRQLEQDYDVVIIDTPPLLPVTDATIVAKRVMGALVVVGTDRLHRAQLTAALSTLSTAGAQVVGVVLNKVAKHDGGTFGYGYGYGYGYTSEPTLEPDVPVGSSPETSAREEEPVLAGSPAA